MRFHQCKNFVKSKYPFVIFLFVIAIAFLLIYYFDWFSKKHDANEIHFFIFLATAVLAIIAWHEFNRSNKLISNEFLLFISNNWRSQEIIKARQILHKLFVDAYRDKDGNPKKGKEYSAAVFEVAQKVLDMSRIKDKEKGDDFIYLLNLLDYLETISYFFTRGDLELKDAQNTCGDNVIFFMRHFNYISNEGENTKKSF